VQCGHLLWNPHGGQAAWQPLFGSLGDTQTVRAVRFLTMTPASFARLLSSFISDYLACPLLFHSTDFGIVEDGGIVLKNVVIVKADEKAA
jgi:hypothetical protein